MISPLLLAIALSDVASAGTAIKTTALPYSEIAATGVPTNVSLHPLLTGSLADLDSPLSLCVVGHASVLAKLQAQGRLVPAAVSQYLIPLLSASPLDRISGAILARVMTKPEDARTLIRTYPALKSSALARMGGALTSDVAATGGPLSDLMILVGADQTVGTLFDGQAKLASVQFGEFTTTPTGIASHGKTLEQLGRGVTGAVYAHPEIAGVVVKIFDPVRDDDTFSEWLADEDVYTTQRLAQTGIGPRVLERSKRSGRTVIAKERIYGETLLEIIQNRRFGRTEYALVLEMLERMGQEHILANDLRMANIMIGQTLLDPTRRSYVVDGGQIGWAPKEQSPVRVRKTLLAQETIDDRALSVVGKNTITTKPLRRFFEEGLARSGAASLWLRLKLSLRR